MKNKVKLPVKIRSINETDVPFVFNSWLKSFRASSYAKHITNEIYYQNHHKLIQQYILKGQALIACDEKDPSQIFGYVVAERIDGILVVHYLYVKQSFRKLGVGAQLLEQVGYDPSVASIFTHATEPVMKIANNYNFIYHPYLGFEVYKDIQEDETKQATE